MLYFNMQKLEEQCGCDHNKLIALLNHHYNKKTIPTNSREKYPPSRVPLHGSSFLVNPAAFFRDKNTDIIYRIQYLKLAAMRDYLLFKQYGYKALQTSFYPDLNWVGIKHNPLLTITPQQISFKYEE